MALVSPKLMPNSSATRSNSAIATSPQLSAPTTTSAIVATSNLRIFRPPSSRRSAVPPCLPAAGEVRHEPTRRCMGFEREWLPDRTHVRDLGPTEQTSSHLAVAFHRVLPQHGRHGRKEVGQLA